ncbi:MAG TPA: hypothetical protein PK990_01160 [Salinivirgaceae bacterium]|nr:hypothetical protein [Salinivirgaceae bacterium]
MENHFQTQIDQLNQKLDAILQMLQKQQQQAEMVEDLVNDITIIGNDAFQNVVNDLAVQNIQVGSEEIRYLVYKILRNIKTFGQLMDMLESMMDLMNDLGPVVHDAGIVLTEKLAELDRNGTLSYLRQLGLLAADIKNHITEEDIVRLRENMPAIGQVFRNFTQPNIVKALSELSQSIATISIDEKTDTKSLFALVRQLNQPEVRRVLSVTLRIMAEIGKAKQ